MDASEPDRSKLFSKRTCRFAPQGGRKRVDEKAKDLRSLAEKHGGRIRSSTFSRDPDGRELADVLLRVPMKNYSVLMQSLQSLGKIENVSVQSQDRTGDR